MGNRDLKPMDWHFIQLGEEAMQAISQFWSQYDGAGYPENYSEYTNGHHWKQLRQRRIEETGGCVVCSRTEELTLHHHHYRSLGSEEDQDTAVLCGLCHRLVHSNLGSVVFRVVHSLATEVEHRDRSRVRAELLAGEDSKVRPRQLTSEEQDNLLRTLGMVHSYSILFREMPEYAPDLLDGCIIQPCREFEREMQKMLLMALVGIAKDRVCDVLGLELPSAQDGLERAKNGNSHRKGGGRSD